MSEEQGYTPPHDIEAEQAVLGAIFVDPTCLPEVVLIIKAPSMFWRTSHQHIYEAILQLFGGNEEVDWVTVGDRLGKNGVLHECGGKDAVHDYLTEISHSVPSAYGAESYATIVRDRALMRMVLLVAGDIHRMALDPTKAPREVIRRLEQQVVQIATQHSAITPRPLSAFAAEALEYEKKRREWVATREPGALPGIGSGLSELDEMTSGWMPGYITTLGMRPGQGKTTLGLQWADYAAMTAAARRDDGRGGALVISTEMRGTELAVRKLAADTGLDSRKIMRGRASEKDLEALAASAAEIDGYPIWIVDNAGITVADIRAISQTMIDKRGTELIIVDYLQNLRAPQRKMDRFERVAANMEALDLMARELEIHIILLSQLNRDYDKRSGKNKRPKMSDLADSGVIERISATIILGHNRKDDPVRAELDLIVEKNRFGPSGTVECIFDKPRSRVLLKARHKEKEDEQETHNWFDPSEKR